RSRGFFGKGIAFRADKRFAGSDTKAVDAFYVRELGGRTMELRTEKGMQEVFLVMKAGEKFPKMWKLIRSSATLCRTFRK
ncbi:MAG: hypothetical protein FWH25_04750, partial [Syntrophorhabdaceae bacterium]|nr:hypothetical protein [Syntrophorhabdaceae bacterium]